MITFLRKIRFNLIGKNTSKYFKYAIGEIILVVVGILIALQINNWNENRKENLLVDNIYNTIISDLKNDIKEGEKLVSIYREYIPYYNKIINKQITKEDLKECNCQYMFISFRDFFINSRGYDLLKQTTNKPVEESSLKENVLNFYNSKLTKFRLIEGSLNKFLYNTIERWEEKVWWNDYIMGIDNSGFIEYTKTNPNFKNEVATFTRTMAQIYLPQILVFNRDAEKLIQQLEQRNE